MIVRGLRPFGEHTFLAVREDGRVTRLIIYGVAEKPQGDQPEAVELTERLAFAVTTEGPVLLEDFKVIRNTIYVFQARVLLN